MIGLRHTVDFSGDIVFDRDEFVLSQVKNRRVLHVGCTDAGFTKEKLSDGSLLHMRLASVCDHLYGVDVDAQGIELLRNAGIGNLQCIDISVENISIPKIDLIVIGEVLEHLSNPGLLVRSVAALARQHGARVVVSVPNAFALFRFKHLIAGVEHVHEDHVAYYSPRTVRVLLARHGLRSIGMWGYVRLSMDSKFACKIKRAVFNLWESRLTPFADGLLVMAEPE